MFLKERCYWRRISSLRWPALRRRSSIKIVPSSDFLQCAGLRCRPSQTEPGATRSGFYHHTNKRENGQRNCVCFFDSEIKLCLIPRLFRSSCKNKSEV